MTREEALQILDTIPTIGEQVDALEMAIKALEQEPCEDCISRQAAIDACLSGWNKDYKEIVEEIRTLPPVTPVEKVGRWIRASANKYDGKRECTECGGWWIYGRPLPDHCPHCGKKMEDGG